MGNLSIGFNHLESRKTRKEGSAGELNEFLIEESVTTLIKSPLRRFFILLIDGKKRGRLGSLPIPFFFFIHKLVNEPDVIGSKNHDDKYYFSFRASSTCCLRGLTKKWMKN